MKRAGRQSSNIEDVTSPKARAKDNLLNTMRSQAISSDHTLNDTPIASQEMGPDEQATNRALVTLPRFGNRVSKDPQFLEHKITNLGKF